MLPGRDEQVLECARVRFVRLGCCGAVVAVLVGGCSDRIGSDKSPPEASRTSLLTASSASVPMPPAAVAPSAIRQGPVSPPAGQAPSATSCRLADQPAFNHYTVAVVNDTMAFPRDGSIRYCWEKRGDRCRGHWGMVHDAVYAGSTVFEGGGDCYCSGHTLEVFLRAYRLWQIDHEVPESLPWTIDGLQLAVGDVARWGEYGGAFYQLWQGFGFVDEASSASAFDLFGMGHELRQPEWDRALPGDYVNIWRKNHTGHAAIFVGWVMKNGARTGIRYYGCNTRGDSCPDSDDPANVKVKGGPSFVTERFSTHGGQVLVGKLRIGRPSMPMD